MLATRRLNSLYPEALLPTGDLGGGAASSPELKLFAAGRGRRMSFPFLLAAVQGGKWRSGMVDFTSCGACGFPLLLKLEKLEAVGVCGYSKAVQPFVDSLKGLLDKEAVGGWAFAVKCGFSLPEMRSQYADALRSENGPRQLLALINSLIRDGYARAECEKVNECIYQILVAQPDAKMDPLAYVLSHSSNGELRGEYYALLEGLGADIQNRVNNFEYELWDADGWRCTRRRVNDSVRYTWA
ncbi:MAG: hypothetical protein LBF24_02075 [Puniceicoccales bacterium]|jgi:hypothetical protein|nr:hypothetical protein [Puniceicoccales bacterium]